MITVYHFDHSNLANHEASRDLMFCANESTAKNMFKAGQYDKVAVVKSNDLEDAFKLTNNIDQPWVQNDNLLFPCPRPHDGYRSTSVGDLMQRGQEYFIVAGFGFRKIELEIGNE